MNDNSIRISGLPYGKHQLTIKGQSANGVFSTEQLIIPISVIRPFYFRWWFILFGIISSGYGLFYYINLRNRRLIFQKEQLEQQVAERTLQIQKEQSDYRRTGRRFKTVG